MKKVSLLCLITVPLILFGQNSKKPMREISWEEKEELVHYLKINWSSPEDYVVNKFSTFDLVIIGEYHRIKHDVELIQRLIPCLYEKGVYNLGFEFGCRDFQDQADRLVTAESYDEDLARWLMFQTFVAWGYKEYIDIYRAAWELNRSLPKDKPKFRIVHLNYQPNWGSMEEKMTPELWKKVWHKGNSDEHMAQVIMEEFVHKNQKALIYAGFRHAFTRYHEPVYDFENKKFIKFGQDRMGNMVYEKVPQKVFHIFLHSPWALKTGQSHFHYPMGGVIDLVMKEFQEKRVGFDVLRSPFGKLRDNETHFSAGYDNFTLETFCDGYIFQRPFKDYEGCTVDEDFITEKNFAEALRLLPNPNPKVREFLKKPADFVLVMKDDADVRKMFRDLE